MTARFQQLNRKLNMYAKGAGSDSDDDSKIAVDEAEDEAEAEAVPLSVAIDSLTWRTSNDKSLDYDFIEACGTDLSNGRSIKMDIPFEQYFYFLLPDEFPDEKVDDFVHEMKMLMGESISRNIVSYRLEKKVCARPFAFGRAKKILKLVFKKTSGLIAVLDKLRGITDPSDAKSRSGTMIFDGMRITVVMFETDIRPVERFCMITPLNAAGNMQCKSWEELPSKFTRARECGDDAYNDDDEEEDEGFMDDHPSFDDDDDDDDAPVTAKYGGGRHPLAATVYKSKSSSSDFVEGAVQTYRHIRAKLKNVVMESDPEKSQKVADQKVLHIDIETEGLDSEKDQALIYMLSCQLFDSEDCSFRPLLFTWNPHLAKLPLTTDTEGGGDPLIGDGSHDQLVRFLRRAPVKELQEYQKAALSAGGAGEHLTGDITKFKDLDLEGIECYNCNSEQSVLQMFIDFYGRTDPDVVVGHNIYGFDLDYLIKRAKEHDIKEYEYLGRTGKKNEKMRTTINGNGVRLHPTPGRNVIDTMFFLKFYDKQQKGYSLEESAETHLKSLNAEAILRGLTPASPPGKTFDEKKKEPEVNSPVKEGQAVGATAPKGTITRFYQNLVRTYYAYPMMLTINKGGIAGEDIKAHFNSESYEDRVKLGLYCLKDTVMTMRLHVERLMNVRINGMAKAYRTPISIIMTGGAGEKVISNFLTQMHRQNLAYNKYHDVKLDPNGSLWQHKPYPGGLVRKPIKGKYLTPVTVLDFGGMYPAIMMEHNVCPNTVLPWANITEEEKKLMICIDGLTKDEIKEIKEKQPHLFRYKRKQVEIKDSNDKKTAKIITIDCVIIQNEEVGFACVIQKNMKLWRDQAKKKMKLAKDDATKAIYDSQQLAYKIYMNGMYGLFAPRDGGKFTYLLVAAIITQYGREMSEEAWKFIESMPEMKGLNVKLIYGDTDSIFYTHDYPEFKTEEDMLKYAFEFNGMVAKAVTASFKSEYIIIELEKHYYPLVLYDTKKYYIGRKWLGWSPDPNWQPKANTHPDGSPVHDEKGNPIPPAYQQKAPLVFLPPNDKPDAQGVESKKRDRCQHLRDLVNKIILLLVDVKPKEAEIERLVLEEMTKLSLGDVPMEKLVIVKGLKKSIEEYDSFEIPHVAVAVKNKDRGQLDSCAKAARISYIVYTTAKKYIDRAAGNLKGCKISEYCEDFTYAKANGLVPDMFYYIYQHHRKLLLKLLSPVDIDLDKILRGPLANAQTKSDIGQTSMIESSKFKAVAKAMSATMSAPRMIDNRQFRRGDVSANGSIVEKKIVPVTTQTTLSARFQPKRKVY